MNKSPITTAAFLAGATTLAVSLPSMAAERVFDLSGFDGVNVTSGISAEVQVGDEFAITATAASDKELENLKIQVRSGVLVVERRGNWRNLSLFSTPRAATVFITLPELKTIKADAGSDVSVQGAIGASLRADVSGGADVDFDSLDVDAIQFGVSSGSDIDAAGQCETLELHVSSGANVGAESLECANVEVHSSSGGNADVMATESVVANASSGGNVDISGNPQKVKINESSGGDVDVN